MQCKHEVLPCMHATSLAFWHAKASLAAVYQTHARSRLAATVDTPCHRHTLSPLCPHPRMQIKHARAPRHTFCAVRIPSTPL